MVIPPGAVRMPLSLDGGGAIVRGSVARLDRFGAAVQVEAVASIDGVERARTEARLDATRPRWTPLSIDLTGLSGDIELALTATPAEADDARFAVAFGSFTVEVVGDPPDAPDVVLVSLDTMRADRMSVNGYGRETTAPTGTDRRPVGGVRSRHRPVVVDPAVARHPLLRPAPEPSPGDQRDPSHRPGRAAAARGRVPRRGLPDRRRHRRRVHRSRLRLRRPGSRSTGRSTPRTLCSRRARTPRSG